MVVKMTVTDTPGFWPFSQVPTKKQENYAFYNRYIGNPHQIVSACNVVQQHSCYDTLCWHSSEGANGYPISYDSYVTHVQISCNAICSWLYLMQKLENPVDLAENHPTCKTNMFGEKNPPKGQVLETTVAVLCLCTRYWAMPRSHGDPEQASN
ncbi:hypothetical protein Cgig2_027828 [Carnegiea gigantea]|uniref:Uncharacterized protein n=1 Tax=Carnegiea gigantea TaxID=171969 RepID=A0A9Q1QBN5_9CARY|nr:hypothetical protein Cgig2_027828 [Carnegiea gigantea]